MEMDDSMAKSNKGEGFYFSEEVGFIPKVKEPNKQKGENKNGKEKGGKQKPKK